MDDESLDRLLDDIKKAKKLSEIDDDRMLMLISCASAWMQEFGKPTTEAEKRLYMISAKMDRDEFFERMKKS